LRSPGSGRVTLDTKLVAQPGTNHPVLASRRVLFETMSPGFAPPVPGAKCPDTRRTREPVMTVSTATAISRPPSPGRTVRVIAAASIGNALEWFDLLVYAYFAVTIAKVFFPSADATASLLATFGTFGVSFLVRPLGAIVLGAYADRAGRKAALLASILLMMCGTGLMAFMPGYQEIGVLAPVMVLVARLMQGFSVGGEFGSATAFLVEHTSDRKGFFASWQWASQGLTALLASGFGVALTTGLSADQLQSWGWRVPFLFGLLIGPVGLYIRQHAAETPEFAQAKTQAKTMASPLRHLLAQQKARLALVVGAAVISNSSNYLILYMPTYAINQLGLPQSVGFIATLIGALVLGTVAPLAGHWSDKIGRTRIMLAMTALFLLTAYPLFYYLAGHATLAVMILAVGWMSLLKAGYSGVLPALLSELFPTETRSVGMSLGYSISVTIFGGFAPFVSTWLIDITGDKLAPSFYLMATALLSLGALLVVRARLRLR
jgi:MHS family proline/betaine transporter-like MFS transporter